MDYVVNQVMNGLAAGSVYALVAVGYSMVYSILYLINFAHGDVYMFGTFVAVALFELGVPIPLVLVLACLAGAALGLIVERAVYRPVRHANRVVPMVSALGAALVLRSLAQAIWGAQVRPFPQLIKQVRIQVGPVHFLTQQLVILVLAAVLVVVCSLLLSRTKLGRATQCVTQDMEAARLMGIPINLIIPLIYALGGLLGVAGGILFAMYYNTVFIGMGILGTTKAWAAAMVGGVGNFYGAFLGGLILGVAESLSAGFIGSGYKDGVALVLIVLVLLVKPSGLLGARLTQRA